MSKIVLAVNSMIANSDKIFDIIDRDGEFFFTYNRKHKWSITFQRLHNDYRLFYYSTDLTLEDLASFEPDEWDGFSGMVSYSAKEIGTDEAEQSFAALYALVKEMRFGVDKALDEIISDL